MRTRVSSQVSNTDASSPGKSHLKNSSLRRKNLPYYHLSTLLQRVVPKNYYHSLLQASFLMVRLTNILLI